MFALSRVLLVLLALFFSCGTTYAGFYGGQTAVGGRLLVFLHGWGGKGEGSDNRDTTWSGPGGAYWPDLVKRDPELGSLDVYVHNYESGCGADQRSIVDLARELRQKLDELPESGGAGIEDYKEIVFVAHSVGGLIAREYLSFGRRHHDKIKGIFLFASPAGGTIGANWLVAPCRGKVLEELGNAKQTTSYLTQLNDRWVTSRPTIKIDSWCATANKDLVVPDELSARLLCNRAIRSLDDGHIAVVKPNGMNHPSHEVLRSWMREVFDDLVDRVQEHKDDIVFANCSESYYSSILQSVMMNVARGKNKRIRLSRLLPIRVGEMDRELLWRKTEPSAVVIHLSCFQQRWVENENAAIQRTNEFYKFLKLVEAGQLKVIVYSKSFRKEGDNYPEFFSPTGLAKRLADARRLLFVQIGKPRRGVEGTPEQKFVQIKGANFGEQLDAALRGP